MTHFPAGVNPHAARTKSQVLIWGRLPDWAGLGLYTLAATAVAWAGYAWFQKTRKGFADVL
jgi:lipopolysaccharide transport system permease protein